MSGCGKAWEPIALTDEGLELRVVEPTSAGELMRSMLVSKAAAARVFARGQLVLVEKGSNAAQVAETSLAYPTRLEPGQTLELSFWREEAGGSMSSRTNPDAPLPRICYQDPVMLAVDKPAGLLVHGDGTAAPTLTAQVQAVLARQGRPAAAQAVQRLDVDTTGLVLFSLTEEFQPALDALVAGHAMCKRYLAAIEGALPASIPEREGWRVLAYPIARDRHDAQKMRVGRTGKPARTRVRTLAQHQGRSLLLVELDSGRRHQIRAHLAHVGRPLVGDSLYGGARHADGLMLHAWQESFAHPATGEPLCLEAPCPERFQSLFPQLDDLLRSQG